MQLQGFRENMFPCSEKSLHVWFLCHPKNPDPSIQWRHLEDPKTPLRNTGSFTPLLEGPWGFLGQDF